MYRKVLLIGGRNDGAIIEVSSDLNAIECPLQNGGREIYAIEQWPGCVAVGLCGMTMSEALKHVCESHAAAKSLDSGVTIRGRKVFIEKSGYHQDDKLNAGLLTLITQREGLHT